MAGSDFNPQLISIRIFTFLSNAALLMASSMYGQYLNREREQIEENRQDWVHLKAQYCKNLICKKNCFSTQTI